LTTPNLGDRRLLEILAIHRAPCGDYLLGGLRNIMMRIALSAALLLFISAPVYASHEVWVHDVPLDANGEIVAGGRSNLGRINVHTGAFTHVGLAPTVFVDIAFDPEGRLFAIEYYNEFYTRLWEINTGDPSLSVVRGIITNHLNSFTFCNALTFGSDGTLYMAGWYWTGSQTRWRVGLIAAQVTPGSAPNPGQVLVDLGNADPQASAGDLVFDGEGRLYLSNRSHELVELDPVAHTSRVVGAIGFADVWGLTYDDEHNVVYGFSATSDELFVLDPTTGSGSLLFELGEQFSTTGGAALYTESGAEPDHLVTELDVKPGYNPSAFFVGGGYGVPLVIMGRANVVARQIDVASIRFFGMPVRSIEPGRPQHSYADVDGDGYEDLRVILDDALFAFGHGDATLTGTMLDGRALYAFQPASDPLQIIGCTSCP
jgi:hypothetical protein